MFDLCPKCLLVEKNTWTVSYNSMKEASALYVNPLKHS